ncbi:hypothetical protein AtubIFM55763_002855 [Aspergillus tubingensis]|uniref:Large ribosomal subunit protein mL44 n=8 Tax=Aspergillus subgen. Circumdati TaxID=2720871 RepID=A0A8G1VPW4_9EURO|nr:60S ribosomal protein L3 [Aspergillus eucalypticola CBS 122712]XP_025475813.1 60S ribosomal protein L3 [Aspergillus neoniger CBS 115656]XP_025519158.1 60S ribosomal protein L3 [Aspergillus piperis CBS 112811]XP_025557025.1 60S ribosomal protein L3 [Aspergillus vadensis CBS 113365]XP_035359665.1 60S ribosomal protein L3 [Aspergillus tubingensis]OJZ88403.1 hypothetical protein ASPFODRAFT_129694 [Aspergillus luchuensis CBS 106.47]BCS09665.1 hypothetical protein ALUC_30482S [Aspergillus luchue
MKRLQLQRWSSSVLSAQARTGGRLQHRLYTGIRHQSTASPAAPAANDQLLEEDPLASSIRPPTSRQSKYQLPSPPVEAARESAKLAALHARLYLPSRLPLETLARSLVDASADPNPKFNNESLATLGHDLLTHYTSEYLICTYPRLPLTVIFAAMYAYVGPKTLAAMAREWGVESAAAPGGEVDPGYLQFNRVLPGVDVHSKPVTGTARPHEDQTHWRKSITSSVVYDNEFGDPVKGPKDPSEQSKQDAQNTQGVTAEQANATFVRAVMGAIYLHAGRPAAKRFFEQHFLSRHLNISDLFNFSQPARDLARLCARENFEQPVARIISETGRKSRHPVFVVGIYSGQDKLGEGAGASLLEARSRAAVAALKGWYLYSPLNVRVPSSMEEEGAAPWKPVHVDLGEVIV